MIEYVKDGAAIYRRSFATIRAEADLAGLPPDVERVAVRMIHSCGMVDLVADLAYCPDVVATAHAALAAGAKHDARCVSQAPATMVVCYSHPHRQIVNYD